MKELTDVARFNPQQRIQSYTFERNVVLHTSQVLEQISSVGSTVRSEKEGLRKNEKHQLVDGQ